MLIFIMVRSQTRLHSARKFELGKSGALNYRCFTMPYKTEPKPLYATALENIAGKRTVFRSVARSALNSSSAITFENNKKIRDQPQAENRFSGDSGGQTGIRTLETVTRLHTFQACAFDHSATCPLGRCVAFVWQRNQDVFGEKSKNNRGAEFAALNWGVQ